MPFLQKKEKTPPAPPKSCIIRNTKTGEQVIFKDGVEVVSKAIYVSHARAREALQPIIQKLPKGAPKLYVIEDL